MTKNSNLRVISGKYRSRTIKSPLLDTTHPMGAREKLALFNIINVEQAVVLDAYAGSGALGIEAMSRGAQAVYFVENNGKASRIIQENLTNLEIEAKVYVEKVAKFLERPEFKEFFTVVLADPPYDNLQPSDLEKLGQVLQPQGVLALSSPAQLKPLLLPGLRLSSTHVYAQARLSIYRKD